MATNEALDQIFAQLSNLTTHVTVMALNIEELRIENENRIEEIKKIAKGLGYSVELATDKGVNTDDDDEISREDLEEKAAIERQRIRNADIMSEQRYCRSSAPPLEEKNNAKLAVEIIEAING